MQRVYWAVAAICLGLLGWVIQIVMFSDDPSAQAAPRAVGSNPTKLVEQLSPEPTAITLDVSNLETLDAANLVALKPRIVGRTIPTAPDGFRHQWPAIYAEVAFESETIAVAFDDAINRYRVTLDGTQQVQFLVTRPGAKVITFEHLPSGPHILRVEKISESLSGAADVVGFFTPSDSALDHAPGARQIEFIGDSDTVGYGNLSPTRDCSGDDVFRLTDTSLSFGPRVARHFEADYHVIASSGIGLIRSLDGASPDATMLHRYGKTLFSGGIETQSPYWQPQVVVLALGPNDFENDLGAQEPWKTKADLQSAFEAALSELLAKLRARLPRSTFLLLEMQDYDRAYRDAYETVRTQLNSLGDQRIHTISIPKMQKTGCHWHPSMEDHLMLSGKIIETLDALAPSVWGADQ